MDIQLYVHPVLGYVSRSFRGERIVVSQRHYWVMRRLYFWKDAISDGFSTEGWCELSKVMDWSDELELQYYDHHFLRHVRYHQLTQDMAFMGTQYLRLTQYGIEWTDAVYDLIRVTREG